MVNNKDFKLGELNYKPTQHKKTQILLMDTFNNGMGHYRDWVAKNEFGYYKTTPYTISVWGDIFEHYNPEFTSTIFGIESIDTRIIPISIENMGWVRFDNEKKVFINWNDDIYGREDDVFVKKWRNQKFWARYTNNQLESLVYLVNKLCNQFDIKHNVKNDNTYSSMSENFRGVTFKSNYSKLSTDINPSMDFNYLKEKIKL